jgi:hypothetical protein
MICMFISEKLKISDYTVFIIASLTFFALYAVFENIEWSDYLPLPIAGYLYRGSGSNFPLFPWAGYVISGGVLGSYLANNPLVFKSIRFSRNILISGIVLFVISLISDYFETRIDGKSYLWTTSPNLTILRLGIVVFITGIVSWISVKVDYIPRIIILIGRNTLLIYIVHLVILYGSAWNPGIILLFNKSFGVWKTVGSALLMLTLMISLVLLLSKLKIKNKQLVT